MFLGLLGSEHRFQRSCSAECFRIGAWRALFFQMRLDKIGHQRSRRDHLLDGPAANCVWRYNRTMDVARGNAVCNTMPS